MALLIVVVKNSGRLVGCGVAAIPWHRLADMGNAAFASPSKAACRRRTSSSMGNALRRLRGHVGATLTIVTAHDPLKILPCSGEISARPITDRFGLGATSSSSPYRSRELAL